MSRGAYATGGRDASIGDRNENHNVPGLPNSDTTKDLLLDTYIKVIVVKNSVENKHVACVT